jgi:hypothetical protein
MMHWQVIAQREPEVAVYVSADRVEVNAGCLIFWIGETALVGFAAGEWRAFYQTNRTQPGDVYTDLSSRWEWQAALGVTWARGT